MTVNEMRKEKEELEQTMNRMIREFKEKTGVKVCGIDITEPRRALAGGYSYQMVTIDVRL
jgi:hypothetical protein